jgi:hypothetical protein
MTFEDLIEDKISNLIMQVLNAKDVDNVREEYEELKLMISEQQNKYWEFNKDRFNTLYEGHYFDLLDRCIDLQNDSYKVTAEELSKVLKLDDELKQYCKEHIEKDGIVAILKYKQSIAKKELIKNALKLAY